MNELIKVPGTEMTAGPLFTDQGLELPETTTVDQCQMLIRHIYRAAHCAMFCLGDVLNFTHKNFPEKYDQVVDASEFKYETISKARQIARQVPYRMRILELTFTHHTIVAPLEPEDQRRWLTVAADENLSVYDFTKLVRRSQHVSRSLAKAPGDLPVGPFNVVLADPPWAFDMPISESRKIERQYPTMPLDKIKALDVNMIAADNCLLFLWCPMTHIKQALEVIDCWGFDYRTHFVWIKPSIGPGHWLRAQHEDLLLAVKGSMPTPLPDNKPSSVIEAPRREHSQKPIEVYEMIEAGYPEFPKCELFARNARHGWAAWINEATD